MSRGAAHNVMMSIGSSAPRSTSHHGILLGAGERDRAVKRIRAGRRVRFDAAVDGAGRVPAGGAASHDARLRRGALPRHVLAAADDLDLGHAQHLRAARAHEPHVAAGHRRLRLCRRAAGRDAVAQRRQQQRRAGCRAPAPARAAAPRSRSIRSRGEAPASCQDGLGRRRSASARGTRPRARCRCAPREPASPAPRSGASCAGACRPAAASGRPDAAALPGVPSMRSTAAMISCSSEVPFCAASASSASRRSRRDALPRQQRA